MEFIEPTDIFVLKKKLNFTFHIWLFIFSLLLTLVFKKKKLNFIVQFINILQWGKYPTDVKISKPHKKL